ncbi:MAG: ParA family protein [Coriobacteriales bacterium]
MYILSIAARKGGVGKTTIAWNIAVSLAFEFGRRVLLVDCDTQQSLTNRFWAGRPDDDDIYGLGDVLLGECDIHDAIVPFSADPKLSLLPSTVELDNAHAELQRTRNLTALKEALKGIEDEYDVVVIDTMPTTSTLMLNAMVAADGIVAVLKSRDAESLESMRHIRQLAEELQMDATWLGAIVNMDMAQKTVAKTLFEEVLLEVVEETKVPVLESRIHQASAIEEASLKHKSVFAFRKGNPKAKRAADEINALAMELVDKAYL